MGAGHCQPPVSGPADCEVVPVRWPRKLGGCSVVGVGALGGTEIFLSWRLAITRASPQDLSLSTAAATALWGQAHVLPVAHTAMSVSRMSGSGSASGPGTLLGDSCWGAEGSLVVGVV